MKRWALAWVAAALAAMAGCVNPVSPPKSAMRTAEAAPLPVACPKGGPEGARCLRGRDSAGAPYLLAVPARWSGVLVVHAHGGPALGEPTEARVDEDFDRWAITLRAGHAWAASAFRQGGVAVRAAAEDTERVRDIFVAHVAQPRRIVLHGQSWGASVAAKAAEMAAAQGRKPWDGVLLTSGVLGGGTRSYDFRLDLRAIYQHLCGNHPAPGEPAYPLWQGLPPASALTRAELASRVDACLGVAKPAAQRSADQAARLKTIVDVVRIPESSVLAHLNWATWHFQDIAFKRAGNRPVFGNAAVRYTGSADDAALNAALDAKGLRWRADPAAVAAFGADTDPDGRIPQPVLTVKGIADATAFVELDSAFRETMARAGTADHLVQTFTDHSSHSYLADPVYAALFAELLDWIDQGRKPTPASVAARCTSLEADFGRGCRMRPDYTPPPLGSRVAPR